MEGRNGNDLGKTRRHRSKGKTAVVNCALRQPRVPCELKRGENMGKKKKRKQTKNKQKERNNKMNESEALELRTSIG